MVDGGWKNADGKMRMKSKGPYEPTTVFGKDDVIV